MIIQNHIAVGNKLIGLYNCIHLLYNFSQYFNSNKIEKYLHLKEITPSDFPREKSWKSIKDSMPKDQFTNSEHCISLTNIGISLLRLADGLIVPNMGNHRIGALWSYFGGEQLVSAVVEDCDCTLKVTGDLKDLGIHTFGDYVEFAENGYNYEGEYD